MVLARGKPILSKEELLELFRSIDDIKVRALVVMLYLTGARIKEMLNVSKRDIKDVRGKSGNFWVVRMMTEKKYDIVEKIKLNGDRKRFVTNKRIEYRNVPINAIRDIEFLKLAWDWIHGKSKNERLFEFSRQRAWKLLKKYDIFPHYLRHLRLTHLVSDMNFTDQELVQFTGWADSKPAKIYTHLRWQDIAKKV